MKKVPNAEVTLGCYLLGSMTEEEFEAWLSGEEVQPAELQTLNEALARFEAIPIEDKIADLKRRFAAKREA